MDLVKFIHTKDFSTALSQSTSSGNTNNVYFPTDYDVIIKNGRLMSGLSRKGLNVGSSSSHVSFDANDYTDANTLYTLKSGYSTANTDNITNFPVTNNRIDGGFFLLNFKEGVFDKQIFSKWNDDHLYIRSQSYVSSTSHPWKAWSKVALTSDIPTTLPASDVSAWAKASTKPTYTWSEITNTPDILNMDSIKSSLGIVNESTSYFLKKDGSWDYPGITKIKFNSANNYLDITNGGVVLPDYPTVPSTDDIKTAIGIASSTNNGLMSTTDKGALDTLKSDTIRYINNSASTPLKCHERFDESSAGTINGTLPIYEVISTITPTGVLSEVSGKAKYIISCMAISENKCIPCVCTRDTTTKRWIATAIDGTTITSGYQAYVKFVYKRQNAGSPSLTNGS